MAQTVKRLPTMRETRVQSLGWEDLLDKEMATHSSILAWKNPIDGGAWQATVNGVAKSQTQLSDFIRMKIFHGKALYSLSLQALWYSGRELTSTVG